MSEDPALERGVEEVLARVWAKGYAQGRIEELELAARVLASRPPRIRFYSNSRKAIAARLRERARLIRESQAAIEHGRSRDGDA